MQNIAIGNYQMPQLDSADVSQAAPSPPPPDLGDRLSKALRPVLGDHNAMLAIVHPEAGRVLIEHALVRQAKSGG